MFGSEGGLFNEQVFGSGLFNEQVFGGMQVDFFPTTFVMPTDEKLWLAQAQADGPGEMWMQKPSGSKNGLGAWPPNTLAHTDARTPHRGPTHTHPAGAGIKVFTGPQPVSTKRGILVQRYVQPPYTVDGLKFNFRLYVVCTDLDPMRLYIYDDAMMFFSGEKFKMADDDNLPRHITNRGYTDTPKSFPKSLAVLPDAAEVDESTRTLEAFLRYLTDQGAGCCSLLLPPLGIPPVLSCFRE